VLAESFPAGWFRQFARLAAPEPSAGGTQRLLDEFAAGQMETLREWRAAGQGQFPYPLYPEPGGLLPWGDIGGGGYAFWLTGPAEPEDWPVVIASQQCDHWDRFDGTVCEFLTEVAAARYDASGFTEGPITVTIDRSGNRTVSAPPVELAIRPVFEPDSEPADVPPVPEVPPADFWATWARPGAGVLPVNEMAVVRELVGPPTAAVLDVDWAAVHARLGFRLPADYREFIDAYGPGTFGDIRIMAPDAPAEMNLFALLERKYEQVRGIVRIGNAPPIYPEPGGAVCWGETVHGWSCGWAPTSADPDEWTVTAIMPTVDLRGFVVQPGVSFSSMLKDHAWQSPGMHDGLVPLRDPADGPVTFTSYQQP
jgi:hypothetical protein